MKLVVQRVRRAQVKVKDSGKVSGKVGLGLFVLVGFRKGDTRKSVDFLVEKLVKLRVMSDTHDKMNLSIKDTESPLLVVSQFTLNADTSGGNRPSFINAEEPEKARELYEYFLAELKNRGIKVETGEFGAYMEIDCLLDGPVTIILEV